MIRLGAIDFVRWHVGCTGPRGMPCSPPSRTFALAFSAALGGLYGCPEEGTIARPHAPHFGPPPTTLRELSSDAEVIVPPFDAGGSAPDAAMVTSTALPADFVALPLARSEPSALLPYDAPPVAPFSQLFAAPRALPPISGGTLAVGASGKVVASDPDRDQIYVIDAALSDVQTLALAPGQEPGRVVIHGERAYVALRAAGALVTLDLTRPRLSASLSVCAAPRGVAFDSVEERVLVACAGGALVAVSADGARILSRAHVAPDLRDVGRDAQGIWVSQYRAATLLRLDAALRVSTRQQPASARVMPVSSQSLVHSFKPTLAWRTVSSPSGEPVMLHQRAQSSTVGAKATNLVGAYGGGGPTDSSFCESGVVHTTISRFGSAEVRALVALPQAVVPTDLSFSADGRLIAAVAPGNFARQELRGGSGVEPQQLYLMSPEELERDAAYGETLTANGCLSEARGWEQRFPGEAIAVQFLDQRALLVQIRSPAELDVLRLDDEGSLRLLGVLPLSEQPVRDTGHEVFHQNSGTGIACASCHGEALDDGHVWTFVDVGARRTQQLRGGALQSAPFHWSGDLASFDALLDDVYVQRMGGAALSQQVRAGLTQWLGAVPSVPSEPGDAAQVARGRALFESAALDCASCHAGERLRSDGRHDVGTGGSFEVPSLRGLSLRLPLMHDGCAESIEKRFDPACGGDQHGQTSQLTPAQLADLVAYLASL